ncbi:hypothetical protein J3E68DRAFT_402556 [Trichoderma sp. SZMC 28012]
MLLLRLLYLILTCCVVLVLTASCSPAFSSLSGLYRRFAFYLFFFVVSPMLAGVDAANGCRRFETRSSGLSHPKSSFPSLTFLSPDAIVRYCETWVLLNDRCVLALLPRGRTKQLPCN